MRVPPRVALPGLLSRATVTVPPVAGFPNRSLTWTVRPNAVPATAFVGGSVLIASLLGIS